MAVAVCTVIAGGGWNSVGAFPANQNDGDGGTYQWWPGNAGGMHVNQYDFTQVPVGANISDVTVTGLWGAGSPLATTAMSAFLNGASVGLQVIGDTSAYGASIPRPGGGQWTRDDIQLLEVRFASLATGNGNAQRLRSSVLTVTFVLGGSFFVAMHH